MSRCITEKQGEIAIFYPLPWSLPALPTACLRYAGGRIKNKPPLPWWERARVRGGKKSFVHVANNAGSFLIATKINEDDGFLLRFSYQDYEGARKEVAIEFKNKNGTILYSSHLLEVLITEPSHLVSKLRKISQ